MRYKTKKSYVIAICLMATLGCMDINPPVRTGTFDEPLLHSISLPYTKAVYGVGDSDSIVVIGTLVNGDTFTIDPKKIQWRISPTSSALEIDSTGKLKAVHSNTTLVSTGVDLRVSYTLGETTRSAVADIYITDSTYDVENFQLTFVDSARSGNIFNSFFVFSLLRGQVLDIPKAGLEVKDINNHTPPQFNVTNHGVQFLSDIKTGKRFSKVIIGLSHPPMYPPGLYTFATAPIGEYWVGIEAYMYGKHLKDSVRFTQMTSAELYFLVSSTGAVPSVTANASTVQPCAVAVVNNTGRDTISIEMPPPAFECNGGIPAPNGRVVVPPGNAVRFRSLGYTSGSTNEWKAFLGSSSQREIAKGSIRSRL